MAQEHAELPAKDGPRPKDFRDRQAQAPGPPWITKEDPLAAVKAETRSLEVLRGLDVLVRVDSNVVQRSRDLAECGGDRAVQNA